MSARKTFADILSEIGSSPPQSQYFEAFIRVGCVAWLHEQLVRLHSHKREKKDKFRPVAVIQKNRQFARFVPSTSQPPRKTKYVVRIPAGTISGQNKDSYYLVRYAQKEHCSRFDRSNTRAGGKIPESYFQQIMDTYRQWIKNH
ncbi:MAG: hypothetical protein Kow0037_30970 [Calditrichia bacterium]